MTTVIRRTHRRPILFAVAGHWHPCDERANLVDGVAVELGSVRGLLHRSPFGTSERDMIEVTDGPLAGRWLPV